MLVDPHDVCIGFETKDRCHAGLGLLHRAFSVYLFDSESRLLLQQRSEHKLLWPLFWSNSCCSHPRPGEGSADAAHRRVQEELGIRASLQFVFKFAYHATFAAVGSEHEVCSVFVGGVEGVGPVDPHEVANLRFITPKRLDAELALAHYTPWLRLGWTMLRKEYWHVVEAL